MTEPQISILENGLRVASWALPGLETAAVAVTAVVAGDRTAWLVVAG